ncbi:hypothetical protein EDC01DRAFT_638604 [Geopyxis carbonaria]|nr:hypothetical protein EDC01DRAFT_638604 [Geopyxis carbonaria]
MSRVSSLGLHTPAALPYCITEQLLPDPPPPESYRWYLGLPYEEILVTGSAVVWSSGGVIRRVFRYDVEKEPVMQAILTWFPSDDPKDIADSLRNAEASEEDGQTEGYIPSKKRVSTWNSKVRSYASQLGSFPKARGVRGAPGDLGIRIEDDDEEDDEPTKQLGRSRALVVFLKTQAFVYFLSGTMHVIHLPFEIQHVVAAPMGLMLQRKLTTPPPPPEFATGNAFTMRPPISSADSPRLFTLIDPLYEVGLVMTTQNSPLTEDLIFMSTASEIDIGSSSNSTEVLFAVTYNSERSQITLWQVRYIPQDVPVAPQRRTPSGTSGTASRRRSSFGPGTGATTPVATGAGSVASSITLPGKGKGRDSLVPPSDAATSLGVLGEEFDQKRSTRRVSGLLARAELSGSGQDHSSHHRFSDVSTSLGASFGGPPVPHNTMILDEQPVDELLNELNMGALGIGMDDLGAYDGAGLKQEMLMHKIETFPFRLSNSILSDPEGSTRVFTLRSPSSVEAAAAVGKEPPAKKIVMFVANRDEGSLLQLTIQVQVHSTISKGYSRRSSTKVRAATMGYTPILLETQKRTDILDAIKLQDGCVQRVLILTEDGNFNLYSPWGGCLDIRLPPTLARWNFNVVGEDGSRRGSRKKGFARTLSTSPDIYKKLDHPEPGGRFTVVDGDGVGHRIGISLAPKDTSIKSCLETLRVVLGAEAGVGVGEEILSTWMSVAKWLQVTAEPESGLSLDIKGTSLEDEWRAFVVTLFLLATRLLPEKKPQPRRKSAFVRSASLVAQREWEDLASHEGEWGSSPEYTRNAAWKWMIDEQDEKTIQESTSQQQTQQQIQGRGSSFSGSSFMSEGRLTNKFITDCVLHARHFLKSSMQEISQSDLFKGVSDLQAAERLGYALVSLHLLREEWKLDIAMEGHARRLCPVLRQIATWLGWTKWAEEYMLEDVEMVGWAYDNSQISGDVPLEPFNPPDIYEWLMACVKKVSPPPFTVLQAIVAPIPAPAIQSSQRNRNPFSPPPAPSPLPQQKPVFARLTPRTRKITALYTVLATPGSTPVNVVEKMVELKIDLPSLQRLPEGISIPLREAISRCQEQPPTTWDVEALDLVGRKDLRMLIVPGNSKGRERGTKWQSAPTHEAVRDIHLICNSAFDSESIGSFDNVAEHDRQSVARLLFKDDRRIQEAGKLLSSSKPAVAKCIPQPQWNESETLEAFKDIASWAAIRTLSTPPGRGLFNFSARIPLLTEKFPISGFNLSCVIKPMGTTVSADKAQFTEEKVCWAFFHSGVASGVSISREAKEIDTSWIVFNKPPDLTNRHAGFLLGLGLNGHLKNIAKWHAFNYLTPKHTMISIGLLLGLSASYLGTMDTTITKLLSVHVTRLLPPGSAELNLSSLTQTAGIMGIGLLYCNTQHRRMSEVMLSEIEYVEYPDSCVPSDTLRDEGYRLAAGFALGFINLGNGADLRGMHDMHLVERLLALAVGSKKVSIVYVLDKAVAGATIALALIYMKTNDAALSKKIDVPETVHLLDYVRPDIFLLRTVAANLIMWDNIKGDMDWIRSRLRPFHVIHYKMQSIKCLDSEDLPFYNIMAGLCFSIALKYAGSGDERVRDVLIHYLDQFIRLCNLPAQMHDEILTKTTVRNCQDLLALSVATVMAGTGDIIVFRRLRSMHGRLNSEVTYGSHLAAHLALGVLFLGNGNFTFGTENIAIASLLCAFYPLFPSAPLDNKSHLQAFRHFWVLAVENRCIIPRDVETFRPTQIPITVTLRSGQEISRTAPCILPELKTIATVTTNSPTHWTVVLDFLNSEMHRFAFERSQSIFVHRRSAHASQSTVFQATLQALDDVENLKAPFEWIGELPAFAQLDKAEKALIIREGESGGGECVDERLELEASLRDARNRSRLRGVGIVTSRLEGDGGLWIGEEVVEGLRAGVWVGGGKRE